MFRDEFYALAVFSGHTHHINTRLIGTHVEDSHVTIDIAFVNHLTESIHYRDVMKTWCSNVHVVRGGVGIHGDRFVAFIDPVITLLSLIQS